MEVVSLLFFVIGGACLTGASPQYYSSPYPGQPFQGAQDPYYSNPQSWQANARANFTNPNPQPNPNPYYYPSPNPNGQSYPNPISAEDIHRQLYGVPQPPPSGFPQIYKIDNLIIIANPPQPQPCIPQPRPPPTFPNPRPTTDNGDGLKDDTLNRMPGDEPSKCTWAIVACCSPDNVQVRYNCFELLGCPGFFFDNSPCEPKIVMAAANAALEFYRSAGNNTASSGSSDTISNRL